MSIKDLNDGIEALKSGRTRKRVAANGAAALGELDLTDVERVVLETVANHYSEIARSDFVTMAPDQRTAVLADLANDPKVSKVKTSDKQQAAVLAFVKG